MSDDRLHEIEFLYRARFAHFLRVANAIVGDRERARDAVQDGFADAIRSRARFRGDGPLEAWVWRAAIFLRYYADLDYRAIADALGIEVGTVSATLATAHASLRNALMEVQR